MAGTTDERLAQAVTGDRDALCDLLDEFGPQVRAKLENRINAAWTSVLDEDDVMQVTYLEAFVNIRQLKPSGAGGFANWLSRIAENNLRDALRGLEAEKRPDPRRRIAAAADDGSTYVELYDLLGTTSGSPSQTATQGEARTFISNAVSQLPPDYGQVVRMYDLEGRPVSEVAMAMNRSPGAIFMLRARAHDRMRELLPTVSNFFGSRA